MPRGVRKDPKTIDEQIAEIETKIQSHQAKLNSLNSKKKALIASKEKAELEILYKAVKKSGKTTSELIAELSK